MENIIFKYWLEDDLFMVNYNQLKKYLTETDINAYDSLYSEDPLKYGQRLINDEYYISIIEAIFIIRNAMETCEDREQEKQLISVLQYFNSLIKPPIQEQRCVELN